MIGMTCQLQKISFKTYCNPNVHREKRDFIFGGVIFKDFKLKCQFN